MKGCDFCQQCGFYQKYGGRKSQVWSVMIKKYCLEENTPGCQRMAALPGFALLAHHDLMPTGKKVPGVFQNLH